MKYQCQIHHWDHTHSLHITFRLEVLKSLIMAQRTGRSQMFQFVGRYKTLCSDCPIKVFNYHCFQALFNVVQFISDSIITWFLLFLRFLNHASVLDLLKHNQILRLHKLAHLIHQ